MLAVSKVPGVKWAPHTALTAFEVESVIQTVLDKIHHLEPLCDCSF